MKKLKWGDKNSILPFINTVDLILAADCLYPDVSSWPDFFQTVSWVLRGNTGSELLLAFHKRNTFCILDPFLKFWNLESKSIFSLNDQTMDLGRQTTGQRTIKLIKATVRLRSLLCFKETGRDPVADRGGP